MRLTSIIINNHNYARFLPAAIESALRQSTATEVIAVDDGSTDQSRDVIAGYGSRVVAVFKEQGGQASAFNAGVAVSQGDVIIFLDADDLLLPTAAERALPLFADLDVAKVHWPLWVVDEGGRRTGDVHPKYPLPEGCLKDTVMRGGPMSHVSPPTSGNAWARWYLQKVLPVRDYGDGHGGDAYLIALAPVYGRIRVIAEPQGCYRVHSGNFSGTSRHFRNQRYLRRYADECRVLSEHLRRVGVDVDWRVWMGPNTPFEWMNALDEATRTLAGCVSPEETFILIDDNQWGEPWGRGKVLPDCYTLPFLERAGEYWGPPPDDGTAIRELERLRGTGATYAVFVWPAFWWLDHYTAFRQYLHSTYRCICETDRVIVFDLRSLR
jgi:hypothetical protein